MDKTVMQPYCKNITIPLRARSKSFEFIMEPSSQAINRRWRDLKLSASGIELIGVTSGVLF